MLEINVDVCAAWQTEKGWRENYDPVTRSLPGGSADPGRFGWFTQPGPQPSPRVMEVCH